MADLEALEQAAYIAGLNSDAPHGRRLMVRRPNGGNGDFMAVAEQLANWADQETLRIRRIDFYQDCAICYCDDGLQPHELSPKSDG